MRELVSFFAKSFSLYEHELAPSYADVLLQNK